EDRRDKKRLNPAPEGGIEWPAERIRTTRRGPAMHHSGIGVHGKQISSIGLLLALLMAASLAAAAEEAPFAVAGAVAEEANHWPYTLVAPLVGADEAPFAGEGSDAYAQAKPSGPRGGSAHPVRRCPAQRGGALAVRPAIPGGPGHQERLHAAP